MPLPIMGALTTALMGGSILQGVQQSKEQKKIAEQQEEAAERQEELIKEQNRKLERIAERSKSNPQAGAQAAALLQQKQYSVLDYEELPYNQENIRKYKSINNLLRHARYLPSKSSGVFLVTPGGEELIGYIGWEGDCIIALEVAKDFRGLGFGDILVEKAIDSGCKKLTVDTNNTKAINLYKKHGFTEGTVNGKRMIMIKFKQKQYSIWGSVAKKVAEGYAKAKPKLTPLVQSATEKYAKIKPQVKPFLKDVAKAGNTAFGDGIASNIATGTAMGVTGYGVGKVIQHNMKKNNLDVDENGTMYQKSYSVLSGIGTAFKAVNKSLTPKVVSSLKKPTTWLIGAGIGGVPTALGYVADKSQMEEQANATRQQRQYSAVGSILKSGLSLVKGKAVKAGQGVANWTKPIRTHTMQTIAGTASNLASFGLAGTKNVQKFGEALSKGNSEIARNAGNWIKNHKTAANAISVLPGAAVAGVTFDGVSNAINKTGKTVDPGAYKYQDSKEQKVE